MGSRPLQYLARPGGKKSGSGRYQVTEGSRSSSPRPHPGPGERTVRRHRTVESRPPGGSERRTTCTANSLRGMRRHLRPRRAMGKGACPASFGARPWAGCPRSRTAGAAAWVVPEILMAKPAAGATCRATATRAARPASAPVRHSAATAPAGPLVPTERSAPTGPAGPPASRRRRAPTRARSPSPASTSSGTRKSAQRSSRAAGPCSTGPAGPPAGRRRHLRACDQAVESAGDGAQAVPAGNHRVHRTPSLHGLSHWASQCAARRAPGPAGRRAAGCRATGARRARPSTTGTR